MPSGRCGLSTSVVDGIIYAIGGQTKAGSYLRTVEAYDPVTDTWTSKADMPTARFGLSTNVVDGIIYAIGGGTPPQSVPAVEAYDPATDTWTTKTEMTTSRLWLSSSAVDGRIYAIAGESRCKMSFPDAEIFATVEVYDTGFTSTPDEMVATVSALGKLATTWGKVRAGH
jgi:hypothetical protein